MMKGIFYFAIACLVLVSCASSQHTATREAWKKVNRLKPLLELSDQQADALVKPEAEYLKKESRIRQSMHYNTQLKLLQQEKDDEVKKILSHTQYLRYDALEGERIKPVPVRA